MSDAQTAIIEALASRRIRARRSFGPGGVPGISLGMGCFDLERFLDILVPQPLDPDDRMAFRIVGRPGDLVAEDEPWSFDVVAGMSDAGFELHATVFIPGDDVLEVLKRLGASEAAG